MSSDIYLNLESVSLSYEIFNSKTHSLKWSVLDSFVGSKIQRDETGSAKITALRDLNLQISSGDRLALLGHNGAGKTTLLRTMAQIFIPETGKVRSQGKVACLIDSGAGIDFESTGLENIYYLGYYKGLSKHVIEKNVKEIVEFSGLGDFINLPMRAYSEGMVSRLIFSVHTSFSADIMIVDEGIGTGDSDFHERARKRLDDLYREIKILVLATHSIEMAKTYCNRWVRLEQGSIVDSGDVESL